MDAIQTELRDWLAGISGNEQRCEQKIRQLLLQNKTLIKDINIAYRDRNVIRVKSLIKQFLSDHKIIVRTCKICNTKNMISSDFITEAECEQCHNKLLGKAKIESTMVEFKESKDISRDRKKCIYCGKPVSSVSNSITCYSCKNIRFDVYSKN